MIVAKLTISYDRGVAYNQPEDLSADGDRSKVVSKQTQTAHGTVVRGLGTHFKTAADAERVKVLDRSAKALYNAFRDEFLATPLDGVYAIPKRGAAKMWLDYQRMDPDFNKELEVRVTEFVLESYDPLQASEVNAWAKKVRSQLASIQLGREKEADNHGLNSLLTLAKCPVLSKATAARIVELVEMIKARAIDKVDLKRKLAKLDIGIDTAPLSISPRRSPTMEAA